MHGALSYGVLGGVAAPDQYRVINCVRQRMEPNGYSVKKKGNQSVSIGERLREERDAQNLTQEALASALGITKKTQGLYERNERSPSADYLSAVQGLGMDVMYILTGQRMPRPAEGLSERESAVLDNFRSLPEEDRAAVQRLTNALAEQGRNVEARKKSG